MASEMNSNNSGASSQLMGPYSRIDASVILMMAYTYYENDPRVMRAAEAALQGGFSVDVIALKRPGQHPFEAIRGVQLYRIQERYRGGSLLRYAWEYAQFIMRCTLMSARLFLERRYKVIHVHNMPDALVFAAVVPKMFGCKVILDIHDPMPETYGSKFRAVANRMVNKLLLLQEKMSVSFADKTITVSEPVKAGVLVKHGYSPERIGVIANFADEDIFRPVVYPDINGTIRFVFHGTIVERYGLRTLVEAVVKVRNRERIRVRIIGEGDFSVALQELIRSYGIEQTVEFVNHAYPLRDIPTMLSDCHVGLVPLDTGASIVANYALPLKLVEYSCLGLPSISIKNAAIEYYFNANECMFFDSGDASALGLIMDYIVERPQTLIEYRERLKGVRERLRWSREKDKYIATLWRLAGVSEESGASYRGEQGPTTSGRLT